jgi:hypothetical protein
MEATTMPDFPNPLQGRAELQKSTAKEHASTAGLSFFDRAIVWTMSTSRQLDGLWIGAVCDNDERALRCVKKALRLIKVHDPIRYDRLLRDLDRVLVGPIPSQGRYSASMKACHLDSRFVLAKTTSPEQIAATIVHEATHARLRRCGIGYDEQLRGRVEAVCVRRELAFARRLPHGDDVRAQAEWALRHGWSDTPFDERRRQELVEMGAPAWVVPALLAVGPVLRWLLAPLFTPRA